jgi:NAD(P)-dependent dehydrogenase (short-subunit alcohol dehydrogenase family)
MITNTSQKVAVITGAARGIGKTIASQLGRDGFAVVIADVRGDAAEEAARELHQQHGLNTSHTATDVSDAASCAVMIDSAVQRFGRVDVLVNNAGISKPQASLEVSPEDWQRMLSIQLNGGFFCAQAAGRQMVQQGWGGSIVNITSINAEAAFPQRLAYSVAKAGMTMLTKTLAIEWAQYNIRVNAVGPCHTETDMTLQNIQRGVISVEALQKRIPLGRLAKTQDVAHAVSFLCAEQSSFITGQSLYVDGGYLAYGYL